MTAIRNHIAGAVGLARVASRQVYARYFGSLERFDGDARAICEQVVAGTWNGTFFKTSLGHYNYFWMRDFGTVAEALTVIGQKNKVHQTLRWALRNFKKADRVTICIDSHGRAFSAPGKQSIDALPWLLHSLSVSHYPLSKSDRIFLNRRIEVYCKKYLNSYSGHLKKRRLFNELRDAVFYDRSAYALALTGRLATAARELELHFPYPVQRYAEELVSHYWNGSYFRADAETDGFSAECALMPIFLGVIKDKSMIAATMDYILSQKLESPYPLKYSNGGRGFHYRFGMGPIAMPNYTGDTIWTWHATFYLHILSKYHRPEYTEEYTKFASLIERHGNYPELVNPDGSWYYAPFYRADPGMVWAALFLDLPVPNDQRFATTMKHSESVKQYGQKRS